MIDVILINPSKVTVQLIQIEENSRLSIAKAICENPTDIGLNPYQFINNEGDMIHFNHGQKFKKEDYFRLLQSNGETIEIYGNAVIVGTAHTEDLDFVYTNVTMSIADLVGNIKFYGNN